ncbi:hypothetical protein [Streptomyces virginiae]|nr:hypothetical protein [Streptomyces virginiae]MCX4957310.1 hypothetical protein [Streptomyces virginiae]MCX5176055.1 hypothetical protein [Streptomyces virginiae]
MRGTRPRRPSDAARPAGSRWAERNGDLADLDAADLGLRPLMA